MKKQMLLFLVAILLVMNLISCGKTEELISASESMTVTDERNELQPEYSIENNLSENIEEKIEPVNVCVSMDELYGDANVRIELLGLQQYTEIAGDDYTDSVKQDGNFFLILYLNIQNHIIENDYINPQMLKTTVDNKAVTNTFLVNDPENYTSIFQHINAGDELNGYIVWEIPSDWKRLSFTYSGWEGSGEVIITGSLTPDDMKAPPKLTK